MALKLAVKPTTDTITEKDEYRANHVAEHVAITIAMNIPVGFDPDSFFDFVIDKVRAKQGDKIKDLRRRT